jgi:predicted amidophosphoribosyltransferase
MKQASGDLLSAATGRLYCHGRGDEVGRLRPDVVTAVPMFWTRRLVRGTNSPDILAEWLAWRLRVPLDLEMVVRRRNTPPQAGLRRAQRIANVRGAFRLRAGYYLEGVRVLVVDDVLTTGATAGEVAGVVKQAGAAMVAVAVLARAMGSSPA